MVPLFSVSQNDEGGKRGTITVRKNKSSLNFEDTVVRENYFVSRPTNVKIFIPDSNLHDEWTLKGKTRKVRGQLLFDRIVCDDKGNAEFFFMENRKKKRCKGTILFNNIKQTKKYTLKKDGFNGERFEGVMNISSDLFTVENVTYKLTLKHYENGSFKKQLKIYLWSKKDKDFVQFYTKI